MKLTWPAYIILAIVAVVSFGIASSLPTEHILKEIANLPGLLALIGVLYQLIRDHSEYEKKLALQRDQQHFALGATSPMASVAFSKHVEFSEKYIARMQKGLSDLFVTGPDTKDALTIASELADIRLSYRAWLTTELQDKVMPFEEALRKIGSRSHLLASLKDPEKRGRVLDEIYDTFDKITNLHIKSPETDERIAAGKIMDHLQDLLGVKQLIQLRTALMDQAMDALEKKN
ncbi:MAG: hypothetical protein KGJ82_03600 [Nitrospirota bacterium]|nr:hypothetical protein [Nitrospirota bacterium]